MTSSLVSIPFKYALSERCIISLNFSDLTTLVLRYTETCSAISFLSNSTARFFSFIFATSWRNFGSNRENSSLMSEKRLITPSLLILCFKSSLILAFISGKDIFLPTPVLASFKTSTRTDSKNAASIRSSSSTIDEQRDNA